MKTNSLTSLAVALLTASAAVGQTTDTWRYYRPGNTGIQGDYNEAIYIGPDNDPWIGGYHPGFEEGGIAKFVQAENRWLNISNVDYPIIGHPDDTGVSRVTEIVPDAQGNLWMVAGRGAIKFNPAIGPSSLVKYTPPNSSLPGGGTTAIEIAPDGTIWFSSYGTSWGPGGLARYNPTTNSWTASWTGYGDGSVAAQPKPSAGYYIWTNNVLTGQIARLDTATQTWTNYAQVTNAPWALVGKACTDAAGNTWMYRLTGPSYVLQVLDCRRPDGSWIGPPVPTLPQVIPAIWAFRAFGDRQALMADGTSHIWRFNGTSWSDLGNWREAESGAYTQDLGLDSAGNVWACGIGGAARRDALTGRWQRYRVTNTSQFEFFNSDLAIDPQSEDVYACANAAAGVGGMERFDGERWTAFNDLTYGLGEAWPFPTDNSDALYVRPSTGRVVVNPTNNFTHEWNGSSWSSVPGGPDQIGKYVEDSLGRLWATAHYGGVGLFENGSFRNVGFGGLFCTVTRDPSRPGTVWSNLGWQILRTDGIYSYSLELDDIIPFASGAGGVFGGMATESDGSVWVATGVPYDPSGTRLIRVDADTGIRVEYRRDANWPFPADAVSPLVVTPDGRLWMSYANDYPSTDAGLMWWDGTSIGTFPAPPGGAPQWGGLPHAGIKDIETKLIPGGYELWMSCISRGIAVLSVTGVQPCALADITEVGGTMESPGAPDGQLTVDDIIVFINLFSDGTGCPAGSGTIGPCSKSDVCGVGGPSERPDGQLTVDDIIAFFNAFSDGC